MSLAACAPCCPCSGNQRLSRWPSCIWPAASVSLTSRSGPPSSRHAAGGSSLSRTSQLSCSKVLLMKPYLFLLFLQYFISFQQKICLCFSRHLPPDSGPVLSRKQAHPSADPGEGAVFQSSAPSSSSPTGTTTSLQPSSPTTQEDFPSGWQPCTAAQTLTCEYLLVEIPLFFWPFSWRH